MDRFGHDETREPAAQLVLERASSCPADRFASDRTPRPCGAVHASSDVDVAVESESVEPGDSEYNATFFGLSTDLVAALGTDDVDLVDLRTLSPPLAESVFDRGVLLVGDPDRASELRRRLTGRTSGDRSPGDRIDAALARIDDHLGDGPAAGASDRIDENRYATTCTRARRSRSSTDARETLTHGSDT